MEAVMDMMAAIGCRACDLRVEALRAEFGAILAERIIEAEEVDFLWEARASERYLGQHLALGWDEGDEVSRVAILSFLDGSWISGVCFVDGDGAAVELVWRRKFGTRAEAESLFGLAN